MQQIADQLLQLPLIRELTMNKFRWLVVLAAYILMSGSVTAPSYAMDRAHSATSVQQAVALPLVATYVGTTVIRTTEPLSLRSVWDVNAASSETALIDFVWKLNDQVVSTSPELVIPLTIPGDYVLEMSYGDTQGRSYETSLTVRVMEPAEYDAMMAAVQAAAHLPLWLEDEELFLPYVVR